MVDILMATYNGEKHLAAQLNSILNQTYNDWKLTIQDDGSNDHTLEIVLKYVAQYPQKIFYTVNHQNSGSAKENFFSMLICSEGTYVMTCDQDDVWLPDKIEKTCFAMQQTELEYGRETPILVHTDLKVVDEQLNVVSDSLFKLQDLSYNRDCFHQILVQNIVSGCTLMVNRALLNQFETVPQRAIMHDWWIALIASAFGQIVFINESTILYRQHENNQVGAKNSHSFSYNWERLCSRLSAKTALRDAYVQAAEFLEIYGQQLDPWIVEMLENYSTLSSKPKIEKVCVLLKYRLLKNNLIRKTAQILFV